jgi:hypothetical protein
MARTKAPAPPPNPAKAVFRSLHREPVPFTILDLTPERDGHGHLLWRVPVDLAPRFGLHHHVVTGRVYLSERPATVPEVPAEQPAETQPDLLPE